MAAGAVCWVSGQSNATAQDASEGLELLRAVKRVIDEDLIDRPERAAKVLGIAIADYRGPNEDVRPVPMIGVTAEWPEYVARTAVLRSSARPQRVTYGITELAISGFIKKSGEGISDSSVISIFGPSFILASSIIRPHWNARENFSSWRGNYPNDTFIYRFSLPRPLELIVRFGSLTTVSHVTIRTIKDRGIK